MRDAVAQAPVEALRPRPAAPRSVPAYATRPGGAHPSHAMYLNREHDRLLRHRAVGDLQPLRLLQYHTDTDADVNVCCRSTIKFRSPYFILKPHAQIVLVLKTLERAIRGLQEPAVEKIAEETQEDHVSGADLDDAVGADPRPGDGRGLCKVFRVARTPRSMAALPVAKIQKLIYPVSFYRVKARNVKETCRQILERFGGRVPATMDELLTLPGVGRKTANLVLILSHASRDNICVDTHVHRISNRLGWVQTKTPDHTEQALYRVVPRRYWPKVNLYLVTWGQNVAGPCILAARRAWSAANMPESRRAAQKTGVLMRQNVSLHVARWRPSRHLLSERGSPQSPEHKTTATPDPVFVLETAKGVIEIRLFRSEAPKNIDHMLA